MPPKKSTTKNKNCYFFKGQLPDYPNHLKPSFKIFHIVQRISARVILCCLSLFFMTMTRVTHNWFAEIIPHRYLDMTNFNSQCYRIHKNVGLYIVVIAIVSHVGFAFIRTFFLFSFCFFFFSHIWKINKRD